MAEEAIAAPDAQAEPASVAEQPTTTETDRHEGVETLLEPGEEPSPEEASPAEVEYVEIDWDDGNKYQVPKALQEGFLKRKDYTEKSQANATTKKELAAERERIAAREQSIEAETESRAELFGINAELKKYEDVDWRQWFQQDPGAVQEHKLYVEQLEKRKAAAEGRLKEVQTTRSREAQQDYAKRVEDTKAFAETKIQGWSPEVDNKIQAFVTDTFRRHGMEDQAIQKFVATNLGPAFYDLAHKAWVGEQTLSKPTTPPKLTSIAPLQTVRAGASPAAGKTLAELAKSDDVTAYVETRRAQNARAR